MQDKPPRRSKRIVGLEIGVLAVLVMLAAWHAGRRMARMPYAIYVDGKPVVTLNSASSARSALNQLRSDVGRGLPAASVRFTKSVTVRKSPRGAAVSSVSEAIGILEESVGMEIRAFAIVVDDKPVVALRSEKDAERALEVLKEYFAVKVDRLSGEPAFKEKVVIDRRFIGTQNLASTPEAAARILRTPVGEPIYHTIRRGDRAVNLAPQYGLTLGDLKNLNPDVNLDMLTEGDRLLVGVPRSLVTVITRGLITRATSITGPSESRYRSGKSGKRHTTSVVTFENDTPVSHEVISQVTVWDKPTPRRSSSHRRRSVPQPPSTD